LNAQQEEQHMNRFENKVALITGAGSGIGRATSIRLAEEGASVFMADINPAAMTETASLLPPGSASVQAVLDVAEPDQCQQIVEQAITAFGQLDVLCNIAGVALSKHLTDISVAEWKRVVDINLNGVFYLCQAAIPHLISSKGNIINMSSSAGREGQAYHSVYCATKAAVLMLSKSLAVEYCKQGVRANAICPGGVVTPLTQNFSIPDDADPGLFSRMLPLIEPMAEAEEIAAAVAYLASDEARFVTGIEFAIDGGQTAG
jgi:meso-butanediol dehydrogenase/(S,S)-butanediol dehydrogenase/diacetyl reductase